MDNALLEDENLRNKIGENARTVATVSYTHLTLPTN